MRPPSRACVQTDSWSSLIGLVPAKCRLDAVDVAALGRSEQIWWRVRAATTAAAAAAAAGRRSARLARLELLDLGFLLGDLFSNFA